MVLWRIEMLGGLRATCGEMVVDRFPTQRTAALLAYLALFPRSAHPRETLAELFWPDAEPESQRHSLRLALSRLRTLLGPDHPLQTERQSVRLDPARFVTDVAEFEGAVARGDGRTALRIYTGPLLPGHYDEWVVECQARLEALLEEIDDTSPTLPDTLPKGFGRLFGRETLQTNIKATLGERRIVTLTGAGGMGKTRLALSVAKQFDGSVWVPLADLTEPRQAADAVRSAMRLPVPAPGFAVEDLVARELADSAPLLLVVDNAEHLLGDTLTDLLKRWVGLPGISILVTSRRALGMAEETEIPVGPLAEAEGSALFEERARRARPGLIAGEEKTRVLVRRLGGMPLALELAAARAGVQGLTQIEAMEWISEDDFGETLGIPARQRSLDAVLRTSLELLPDDARQAFGQLGVFRGGFDAAAAQAVAGAGPATLETLRRWSLIVPSEEPDGSLRFRMLEPLRDIARQGKDPKPHARYFAAWVESNRADDLPPPPRHLGMRLALQERERDNVRAALETFLASEDHADREKGLRIVAAFWTHWYVRNASEEMERWATKMLAGPGELANPLVRASARLTLALALRERGAREAFAKEVREALDTLLQGPRDRNLGFAWHLQGFSLGDFARWEESEAAYLESEAVWQEIGDRRNYAIARHNRAMLAAGRGQIDKAEALVGEAMEIFQTLKVTYIAVAHATIANIRRARGDQAGAAAAFEESSRHHHELGYVRGWAESERDLALCLHALGRDEEAQRRARGSLAAFRRVGDRHGEATALVALARVTGERWHEDEARGVLRRHNLPPVGELLESLGA